MEWIIRFLLKRSKGVIQIDYAFGPLQSALSIHSKCGLLYEDGTLHLSSGDEAPPLILQNLIYIIAGIDNLCWTKA